MQPLIVLIAALLLVLIILGDNRKQRRTRRLRARNYGEEFPYRRKQYLLSRAEAAFFSALRAAAGEAYLIMAKVRMEDLLLTVGPDRWRQRNRIKSRHIDFVLCTPGSVSPVLAIELDDGTHDEEDARDGDRLKDEALRAAELPLLRVRARGGYDPRWINEQIAGAMAPPRVQPIGLNA